MAVTGVVTPSSTQLTQLADDLRLLQLKLVGMARGDSDPVWDALGALERAQIILRKEAQYDQDARWEQVQAQAAVQPVFEAALAKLAEPPQPGKSTLFIGTTDPTTNSLTPFFGTGAQNAPVPVPAPAGSPPGVFEPDAGVPPETHVALPADLPPEAPEGTIYVAGMLIPPGVPTVLGAAEEHPLAGFGQLFMRVKGERDAERRAGGGDEWEAGAADTDAEDAGHAGGTEPAAAQEEEAGATADTGAGTAPARDAAADAGTSGDGDGAADAAGDAGARAGSPEPGPEADGPGEEGWRAWWQSGGSGASRGSPAWGEAGEGS